MLMKHRNYVELDGESLTIEDLYEISENDRAVALSHEKERQVQRTNEFLHEKIARGEEIYGVTVALGHNANQLIAADDFGNVSDNLISYLNCGLDEFFPVLVSRATMAARANSLVKGYSGIKLATLQRIVEFLNRKLHPLIPRLGSCGASGDLVPLSYIAAAIRGDGVVEYAGRQVSCQEALAKEELTSIQLSEKEGLSIVNGTSMMTAIAALTYIGLADLVLLAEALTVFCTEVFLGNAESFDHRIHSLRPHPGQITTAKNMIEFSRGSSLLRDDSHLKNYFSRQRQSTDTLEDNGWRVEKLIQLPYSIRTVPQIFGYTRDALQFSRMVIETELNSVSDNPLLFADEEKILHGGNFQGGHISAIGDLQAKELSIIAKVQHSQMDRLINPAYRGDLPEGLIPEGSGIGGLSGLQICMSSIIPRLMMRSFPIANSSVITDGGNQDFVSMGAYSAERAYESLHLAQYCSTILLYALCQAAEFRGPQKLGPATKALYDLVREKVPFLRRDKPLREDIAKLVEEVRNRSIPNCLRDYLATADSA